LEAAAPAQGARIATVALGAYDVGEAAGHGSKGARLGVHDSYATAGHEGRVRLGALKHLVGRVAERRPRHPRQLVAATVGRHYRVEGLAIGVRGRIGIEAAARAGVIAPTARPAENR